MKEMSRQPGPDARPLFISFEGPEGGGKSTQVRRLARTLEACGHSVLCTREPGGTRMGEAIRDILQHEGAGETPCPQAETLLFSASRAQLVRTLIRPALADGRWVVCDRFADSTTAYQGYGRGFDIEALLALHRFALDDTWPDLTFLLDLDVEDGFRRLRTRQAAGGREPDRMEREDRAFHTRVRAGYLELAARWPRRFRILDAAQDTARVAECIWKEVCHGPTGV